MTAAPHRFHGAPAAGSGVYSIRFPKLYRPTWAEIDLRALRANLERIQDRVGRDARILFVVKADGYGHGAVEVARAAVAAKHAAWLGVSSVEEGAVLREAGLRVPILILGSLYPFESTLAAIRYGLTPTVASLDGAKRLVRAAGHLAPRERRRLPLCCHLKIDTGMGRIGVRWPAGREVVEYLLGVRGVRLQGIYTHLARADEDALFTRRQLAAFAEAVAGAERLGGRIPIRHAANSAGALRFPESRWDLVRPGLAAYGLFEDFTPVLSLKTRVVFLKQVRAGTWIGYGRHHRMARAGRVATLPIGYGDGLPRQLSAGSPVPGASVLIRGRRCPILGAVTMDMTMVDVSGVPRPEVGDEAVLIGRSGKLEITAGEVARRSGTIPYQIATGLSARVPRVYLR